MTAGESRGGAGVLLMAYGTPESADQVGAYFTHIRGGRTPSADSIARLAQRYEQVGGRTPLLEITTAVAAALEHRLQGTHSVFVGMKHWHPYIADTMTRMAEEGISELIAIPLAPHYSRMSIGGYRKAVEDAHVALGSPFEITFVESWHLEPRFIDLISRRVEEGLTGNAGAVTVFSAHSLPVRIREWNDPYEAQLLESCAAVAAKAGLGNWRFAWQSAGHTGEPWLGPDIVEVLRELRADGIERVLSVPIGFVSDHLEILYDIDHEAMGVARELGMSLRRTRMPNADPAFIEVLAAVVLSAAKELHVVTGP
jgi:ferrochelatase